jgi:CBS domain-containing protein
MNREKENYQMRSLMTKVVVSFKKDDKIIDIAKDMASRRISCAVITDDKGAPVGIITERDLVSRLISKGKDPKKAKAKDIMSAPVISVDEKTLLIPAVHLMNKKQFRRIVITKNKKVSGIITQTDITKQMMNIIKHLNWQLISMEISVEDYIKKLKKVI